MSGHLSGSVQYLKGVGPARANGLSKLGILTIRDLLYYFPKRYEDRRLYKKILELKDGEIATVSGKIELTDVVAMHPKLAVFKAAVSDGSGIIFAMFYKRPSYRYDVFNKLKTVLVPGTRIILHGRVEIFHNTRQIRTEEYEVLAGDETDRLHTGRIVPVYPGAEGVPCRFLRSIIKQAVERFSKYVPEIVPPGYEKTVDETPVKYAMEQIHFPDEFDKIERARKRLAFDEFLILELAMLLSKRQHSEKRKNRDIRILKNLLTPFRQRLGFDFTRPQKKVINEIFMDMTSAKPMNRLLMGDVGSGKTVVALSAVLLAIENGYQAAMMAPTEILAEQHYYTTKNFLNDLSVRTALLTGSTPQSKKRDIVRSLAEGGIDLLIGTHALIESRVRFGKLALVVIDEQHKFGVMQRHKLHRKGALTEEASPPDVLIMTATPIPRTLALTIYGDLDVSVIDELPSGRLPVTTMHADEPFAWDFIAKKIREGRQAYIVFPLVEESDKIELKAAVQEARRLSMDVFPEFRVGLLHGQMKGADKEKAMLDFRDRKYDILIATTVIEIGIDIPDATVIVIEHADRFGLSTLHQLRGRVGRKSGVESYCLLLGEPKTDEAKKRMNTLISTTDGFVIAEKDLEIRGPGEFFGVQQHGALPLKIGDIFRDIGIINRTRKLAGEILSNDPALAGRKHLNMKEELIRNYAGRFFLPQTG
ncbi:MAG: ATP-dependent DNA helicase RecG [Elusimicrobiota bacterium]